MNKKLGVKSAKELNGATVCVAPGTTTELNLADYFRANKMTFKPVVIEKVEEVRAAFFSGRCDVYTNDSSSLYATRAANVPAPATAGGLHHPAGDHLQGAAGAGGAPRRQPVRRHRALDAVRHGRGRGIRHQSKTVDEMLKSDNPTIKRILGVTPGMGKALGVDEAWVVNIIKQVGNYGESFERNVGSGSPLKIDRGLNKLWTPGRPAVRPADPLEGAPPEQVSSG